MKRLTLDETWEQCLAMWKWISRRVGMSDDRDVEDLKMAWLLLNGYVLENSDGNKGACNDCFFCEYDNQRPGKSINNDCFCPGRKVDKDFSCHNREYNHSDKPRAFYAELKRLNKIRLAGKK